MGDAASAGRVSRALDASLGAIAIGAAAFTAVSGALLLGFGISEAITMTERDPLLADLPRSEVPPLLEVGLPLWIVVGVHALLGALVAFGPLRSRSASVRGAVVFGGTAVALVTSALVSRFESGVTWVIFLGASLSLLAVGWALGLAIAARRAG